MNSSETLGNIVRAQVSTLAHSLGTRAAARKLSINKDTLARICAGLPVRDGTILAAAHALGIYGAPAPVALSTLPTASDVGR